MKGEDRVLAVLEEGLETDFPVVFPYISIFLRDHWKDITKEPWWVFLLGDSKRVLKVYKDFLHKVPID